MFQTVNAAIQRSVAELQRGLKEALAEVRRLKDEALEVGKEVGRYQQMLQDNKWLIDLEALVKGTESLEAKQVRVIVLAVLRGTAVWLKPNEANKPGLSSLSYAIGNLIRELEQWKP